MLHKLTTHQDFYEGFFLETTQFKHVYTHLFWEVGSYAAAYWMDSISMGEVITNTYECVVVCLSPFESITYLPFRAKLNAHKPIVIAFVNNNHFISVDLQPMAPFPEVHH